jgi:hypothetical protein
MAAGVVVSRMSPGLVSLSEGSFAIEPRYWVAKRAREARHGGRPAQRSEQQDGGRIVAPFDRRFAQRGERHVPLAHKRARHRRVFEQVRFAIRDKAGQFLRAEIHFPENRRRRQQLKRAAHREALVRAMRRRRPDPVSSAATPRCPPCWASSAANGSG